MEDTTQHQEHPNHTQGHNNHSGGPHTSSHHTEAHKLPPKLPPYSALPQLEEWLEEYLGQKAPQLPLQWRQTIAKIGPWVTLVIFILTVPLILAAFGFAYTVLPAAAITGYHWGAWNTLMLLLTAGSLVLEIIALPGLFKRQKKGWVFIFYAALLGVVSNVLMVSIGSLLGSIISLYIIFQIKNQYK